MAAASSDSHEGVRFDHNHVRSYQLPSLFTCLGEERPGSLVVKILWDKHREEGTGVDEDALHRTFS